MAKKESETVTLAYKVGEHPEVKNRIVIAFDNTGMDIKNPKHKRFLGIMSKVFIAEMYAKANDISRENIDYDLKSEE